MKNRILTILAIIIFSVSGFSLAAQGFLHVDGKNIVNGQSENVILKGIGTGNWLIQEGYMMKTAGIAGTQTQLRNKLIETIGEEKTNVFFESWLKNHFRKVDVDSMAAWGFNSVRVAMHYKWLTLPIEEEPVQGEDTWLEEGFQILDSLLSWCGDNEMYLILDLHGAPGGQGKNRDISDYDPAKPSLWESDLNKDKTVALWRKLSERYANEPWLGGYDLINEVNWTFKEGNNSKLRELFIRITDTIREVDNNHIIFIEGNGFANDFSGLTPPWDENMVYSFHKYWTYNDENSLNWVLNLRNETNRPLWLGESGENSNSWFTSLVELAEKNNIGWSWWPVKKSGINNILRVETNEDYLQLIETWKGNGTMSSEDAFNAVMKFSENHRFENCTIQYDVIDALIRQPGSLETKPYKKHSTGEKIFAVDYDLGRVSHAYYDTDTADYHLNTDEYGAWNNGWIYRSDGVDIEECQDEDTTIGYHVGWTKDGEWLQYTIDSKGYAAYEMDIRTAGVDDAKIHVEVDGKVASKNILIPASGDWDIWKTTTIEDIILPEGNTKVKIVFDKGGLNVNYFQFVNPKGANELAFDQLSIYTAQIENKIFLNLNKQITSENINESDFQLIVNNKLVAISEFVIPENNNNQIILITENELFASDNIKLTYKGSSVLNDSQPLTNFTAEIVENKELPHFEISERIEAEEYYKNIGFNLEECNDTGGGENTAFANNGDYLDYILYVGQAGIYKANFRVASLSGTPEFLIMNSDTNSNFITANKSLKINPTGGWQNWETQSVNIALPRGKIIFRIYSTNGEYNINWFSFDFLLTKIDNEARTQMGIKVYPNPADKSFRVDFQTANKKFLTVYDMQGKQLMALSTADESILIDTANYPQGNYILRIIDDKILETRKVQICR